MSYLKPLTRLLRVFLSGCSLTLIVFYEAFMPFGIALMGEAEDLAVTVLLSGLSLGLLVLLPLLMGQHLWRTMVLVLLAVTLSILSLNPEIFTLIQSVLGHFVAYQSAQDQVWMRSQFSLLIGLQYIKFSVAWAYALGALLLSVRGKTPSDSCSRFTLQKRNSFFKRGL